MNEFNAELIFLVLIAIVRIRGVMRTRGSTESVFRALRLTRKNHCVLAALTASLQGMLLKTRDYATWGEASDETVALLKKKFGENEVVYRLQPPRGGFKGGIRQHYPKGALGFRGEKINDLIKAMI
ncbi:MAG: uL30 family ribosomal protein [Candidatus Micrarchaeota archaeon]